MDSARVHCAYRCSDLQKTWLYGEQKSEIKYDTDEMEAIVKERGQRPGIDTIKHHT